MKKIIALAIAVCFLGSKAAYAQEIDKVDVVQRLKKVELNSEYYAKLKTTEKNKIFAENLFDGKLPDEFKLETKDDFSSILSKYYDYIMKKDMNYYGFYAIKSYEQLNHTKYFDATIVGWSNFDENGIFTTTKGRTEFRKPEGAEQVLSKIEENGKSYLMVFESDRVKYEKILSSEENIKLITENLKDYDGICLDLESMRDENGIKEKYNTFVNNIKKANPDKKIITVVHPKNVIGYFDGYDYKTLGEISDYILLMSYDYQTKQSPQSTAPFDKVLESVEMALKEVPSQKLILGIQAQGAFQWRVDKNTDLLEYYVPTTQMVEKSMSEKKILPQFDKKQLSNFYTYEDEKYKGTIYYESPIATNYKIYLAKEKNLGAVAIWRLGTLNEEYFKQLK